MLTESEKPYLIEKLVLIAAPQNGPRAGLVSPLAGTEFAEKLNQGTVRE